MEPLPKDELRKLDAYWRAANYLTVAIRYRRSVRQPHVGHCD